MVGAWSFFDVVWHLRTFSAFIGQHICMLSQQEAVEVDMCAVFLLWFPWGYGAGEQSGLMDGS